MREGRDLEAAAVADRLRAFVSDPSRVGPRYVLGMEPLPDGATVLRFAHGRFSPALRLAPVEAERLRRAADDFVRRVCLAEGADHYHALCVPREAPAEAIKENYHLLMSLLHPDRQDGAREPWPEACAQRVNLAYATLGDDQARREYDARIRVARHRAHGAAIPHGSIRAARGVRFAKSLIAVSSVVAILVVAGLVIEDDEWAERSLLQANLARLQINPAPGADRPRFVGATAMAPAQRATDANVDAPDVLGFLRPLMRALTAEEPKPWVPPPAIVRIDRPAPPAPLPVPAPPAPLPVPAPVVSAPPAASVPAARPPRDNAPLVVAQADRPASPMPTARPVQASIAPRDVAAAPPSSRDIESLVVELVGYYEAGDADRLVSLVDAGFWRTAQIRQTYADFFRSTRARRVRIERLDWDTRSGVAHARGEAVVTADYFDQTQPVQRRVEVELDIGMREGRARITRLTLFPER